MRSALLSLNVTPRLTNRVTALLSYEFVIKFFDILQKRFQR
jgi:hypothetical protein